MPRLIHWIFIRYTSIIVQRLVIETPWHITKQNINTKYLFHLLSNKLLPISGVLFAGIARCSLTQFLIDSISGILSSLLPVHQRSSHILSFALCLAVCPVPSLFSSSDSRGLSYHPLYVFLLASGYTTCWLWLRFLAICCSEFPQRFPYIVQFFL